MNGDAVKWERRGLVVVALLTALGYACYSTGFRLIAGLHWGLAGALTITLWVRRAS